jgi:NADH:ubiquinone oxidoreductase subunit 5 (subunit L)/multisubunit Na+/H+ antiporter MnhA subunit
MTTLMFLSLIVPFVAGLLILVTPRGWRGVQETLMLAGTLVTLAIAVVLFNRELAVNLPWVGFGLDLSFRLYHFSSFILLAVAAFGALIALYSTVFMSDRPFAGQFFAYLLFTVAFAAGSVLANNLVLLLFFWEGSLLTVFGLIIIGRPEAYKTAIKAFVIVGITDLCLLFGVTLAGSLAGSFTMTALNLPLDGWGSLAFVFMMIGAVAKGGAMPFHTWIPDAALDAPLPFMALVPAAIEKLLGIYLLARISLDLFQLTTGSWVSVLMMVIGALTILLAVMMALIQKDYKKLLSYHAISQVGYMILGIGTALPVGIVGGIFHMINHAMYKSCLFLTGGSVEKQTGTTDLSKLGGLLSKMPITFACFAIAAASISGVPPFNGFFSKELVYDGALERGWIFYLAAVGGTVLTAASFLKLGHAAYFGKGSETTRHVQEAPWPVLLPMIVIAFLCVLFGVYNPLPLNILIQPILGARLEHSYAGLPGNWWLVLGTVIALGLAVANHIFGVKRTGKGIGAADHIHYAPGLSAMYDLADRKFFDPYDVGMKFTVWFSRLLWRLDRLVDWLYETAAVGLAFAGSALIRWCHSGNLSNYVVWSLAGTVFIIYYLMR